MARMEVRSEYLSITKVIEILKEVRDESECGNLLDEAISSIEKFRSEYLFKSTTLHNYELALRDIEGREDRLREELNIALDRIKELESL